MTAEERGKIIEVIATGKVAEQAIVRTQEYLCQECLDRRCDKGQPCRAFEEIMKGFAWEIMAERAELN